MIPDERRRALREWVEGEMAWTRQAKVEHARLTALGTSEALAEVHALAAECRARLANCPSVEEFVLMLDGPSEAEGDS